jgi:hypothetical protein
MDPAVAERRFTVDRQSLVEGSYRAEVEVDPV